MGQNGAGKSTLIKVLTGLYEPDAGRIELAGQEIAPRSTQEAQDHGIRTVYQEVNLCPNLRWPRTSAWGGCPRWGRIDWAAVRAEAQQRAGADGAGHRRGPAAAPPSVGPAADGRDCAELRDPAKVLIPTSPPPAWTTRPCSSCLRCCAACATRAGHPLRHPLPGPDLCPLRPHHGDAQRRDRGRVPGQGPGPSGPGQQDGRRGRLGGREGARLATTATADGAPVLQAEKIGRSGALQPMDVSLRRGEVPGLAGLLGLGSHGAGPFAVWCRCGRHGPPARRPAARPSALARRARPLRPASPSARKTANTRAAS